MPHRGLTGQTAWTQSRAHLVRKECRHAPTRPRPLAFSLLAPAPAWSADLPVSYTVNEKQLKAALSGTLLTFNRYADAACTSLQHTDTATINAVRVRQRLGEFKPQNGTSRPKGVESPPYASGRDGDGSR